MSCPATSSVPIRTYRPTEAEFADFPAYVAGIEVTGGHLAGVCKVIPPSSWQARRGGYADLDRLVIPKPIRQRIVGTCAGVYSQWNETMRSVTVAQYREMAQSELLRPPPRCDTVDQLERKYWAGLTLNPPIYGADVSGSLTDADQPLWNMRRLGTILDDLGHRIEGVNTPYLYFGMWKTTFPWHTEDMDLYSINYLHYGAPKHWYSVPPAKGRQFERLAQTFFGASYAECPAFLRHKTSMMSPQLLRRYGVPFGKVVQHSGEFVITFPFGYHCGFNAGYNCAESTNFASRRWLDYGLAARVCRCQSDSVLINMAPVLERHGPARLPSGARRHPAEVEAEEAEYANAEAENADSDEAENVDVEAVENLVTEAVENAGAQEAENAGAAEAENADSNIVAANSTVATGTVKIKLKEAEEAELDAIELSRSNGRRRPLSPPAADTTADVESKRLRLHDGTSDSSVSMTDVSANARDTALIGKDSSSPFPNLFERLRHF